MGVAPSKHLSRGAENTLHTGSTVTDNFFRVAHIYIRNLTAMWIKLTLMCLLCFILDYKCKCRCHFLFLLIKSQLLTSRRV